MGFAPTRILIVAHQPIKDIAVHVGVRFQGGRALWLLRVAIVACGDGAGGRGAVRF